MAKPVTIGIFPQPQAAPFDELVGRVRWAEEHGFGSIWLADETPMAYPGAIAFEAWSTLCALARETTTVTLGTMVTPPVMRHPLVLAMHVSTLDHASGGRAILGMGVGGVPEDDEGLGQGGQPRSDLVDRLAEQLDSVDRLLRGETVTREEGFYRLKNAVVERPIQSPRPPILVAAQGPRTLKLAARVADAWNSLGGQPIWGDRVSLDEAMAETRRQMEILEAELARIGRPPDAMRRTAYAWRTGMYASFDLAAEWIGRYRELGFDELVLIWPPREDEAGQAVLERIAKELVR